MCAAPAQPPHADGQGRVSAHGALGWTPPGLALSWVWPHAAPAKLPFQLGAVYWGGGKASVGFTGNQPGWWGPLGQPGVSSHPQGQRGWGQRWQCSDAHSPARLSRPTEGNAGRGSVPPKRCPMEVWTLQCPHQSHAARGSDCARCCHSACGESRVLEDHGGFGVYWDHAGSSDCPAARRPSEPE